MGAGGGPLPTALRGCFGHHMAKGGASLDLRDGLPYGLRAGTAPYTPMAKGGFGHLRVGFSCVKTPWDGRACLKAVPWGPLRLTSGLVQVASFPPTCSALKKFSACKNYITKNLRRLKNGGQTCYLHLTGGRGSPHWEGCPMA